MEIYYFVVGLTGRKDPKKDVHVRWKSVTALAVGDVLQVRILETDLVDPPQRRENAAKDHLGGTSALTPALSTAVGFYTVLQKKAGMKGLCRFHRVQS